MANETPAASCEFEQRVGSEPTLSVRPWIAEAMVFLLPIFETRLNVKLDALANNFLVGTAQWDEVTATARGQNRSLGATEGLLWRAATAVEGGEYVAVSSAIRTYHSNQFNIYVKK